ncbi:hypothetical protein ABT173_39380 [Streptomyces sp. NPDC001795]|uniref:hypothetical protein n=1 Tax=unclassified Streptomyces TaxID=2593676 RepID=UPI003325EED7
MSRHAPTAHPQTTGTQHGVPVVDISDVGPGRTPIQQAMELMRGHGPGWCVGGTGGTSCSWVIRT